MYLPIAHARSFLTISRVFIYNGENLSCCWFTAHKPVHMKFMSTFLCRCKPARVQVVDVNFTYYIQPQSPSTLSLTDNSIDSPRPAFCSIITVKPNHILTNSDDKNAQDQLDPASRTVSINVYMIMQTTFQGLLGHWGGLLQEPTLVPRKLPKAI